MATAVIYLRVSDESQVDGASLKVQEAEGRAYCAQRGYDVIEVVREVETGVDSYDWRPGLGRVRDLLRSGAASCLVVWKFDRVNRDSIDNLLLLRLVDSAHARLESVHDGVVENDMAGRMKVFMYGESGRNERDNFVLRSRAGLRQRVADGMPRIGKFPLYGYRYTYGPGRRVGTQRKIGYELEPETAAIVRRCYEKIASGYTLSKLQRELTQEGVPTPTQWLARQGMLKPGTQVSEVWNRPRLRQILTNPSYTGKHVVNRTKTTKVPVRDKDGNEIPTMKPRKVAVPRAEGDSELVVLSIPAIVSEELFTQVQARMTANRAESVRRNRDPESTLLRSGFAFCGHCGAPMVACLYHNPKRPNILGYRVYTCSRRRSVVDNKRHACPGGAYGIRAAEVDADTWRKVSEIARDTDKVQRLIDSRRNKAQEVLNDIQRESAALATDIEMYETQRATLQRRMATEADDGVYAVLREELQRVNAILKGLEKKRKAASSQVGKYTITLVSLRELVQRLELGKPSTLAEIAASLSNDPLANATYQEKREIMRLLGVRVRMYAPTSEYARAHGGARWEFAFQPEPEIYSVNMRCQ